LLRAASINKEQLSLPAPTDGEELGADYKHQGFNLGRHSLAQLHPHLPKMQFIAARDIANFLDRQLCRACGPATVRQRRLTASEVVFSTFKDDTGTVNVVIGPNLVEEYRSEVMRGSLLEVLGQ
jgi:error-prone DNA polymerase